MVFMINQNEIQLSHTEIYEFFLFLQSLDDLKRAFVMVLLHVYPKELTTSQLTQLAGYSKASKHVFKSKTIETLENEGIITVNRPYQRLMLLKLNSKNSLLEKFSFLFQQEGKKITEDLLQTLLELK